EKPVDDKDDQGPDDAEEGDTEEPAPIENLRETTPEPVTRPSVQAPEPPPVPAETPTRLEALNNPFETAERGSNAANSDTTGAAANSQPMTALPQNPGPAPGTVSNSPFANSPIAQAETNNPGSTPQGIVFGPQNLL